MVEAGILRSFVKRLRLPNFESARDTAIAVLLGALLIWAGSVTLRDTSPAKAPPRINGAYTVTSGGDLTGKGKAIVTPQKIKIDGTFLDAQGNAVRFSSQLDFDSSTYRFNGSGSVGKVGATISGRVDADDKTLKKCRIVATYLTEDGKTGRIVGAKD